MISGSGKDVLSVWTPLKTQNSFSSAGDSCCCRSHSIIAKVPVPTVLLVPILRGPVCHFAHLGLNYNIIFAIKWLNTAGGVDMLYMLYIYMLHLILVKYLITCLGRTLGEQTVAQ